MTTSSANALIFLLLALASVALPAVPISDRFLEHALAHPADVYALSDLYNGAILRDGEIGQTVAQLERIGTDGSQPKVLRSSAIVIASSLYWRHGQIDLALAAAGQAMTIDSNAVTVLQKARLLDAKGAWQLASTLYEKVMAALPPGPERERIALRLVLMRSNDLNPGALLDYAAGKDEELRNRAALALALMNHVDEASRLYTVNAIGAPERLRQLLRVTDWALQARNGPLARKYAWEALSITTASRDRLYVLSLLMEAHRLDGRLGELDARLAQMKELPPEAQQLRIDLLRELGRLQDAAALIESDLARAPTTGLRDQVIDVYREAGRTEKVVAEYRRLIEREPAEVEWYTGLAERRLIVDDRQGAQDVWRGFLSRNTDPQILMSGAQSMSQMGLDDLAVDAMRQYVERGGDEVAAQFFLFELYRQRSWNVDAEQQLAKLDRELPPLDVRRKDVADDYQRLTQSEKALEVLEAMERRPGGLDYDGHLRLAQLLISLGRLQRAFGVWQSLWSAADSPARASFVEDQWLMVAAKLERLDAMAAGLEKRLASGKASAREARLLVRIYVRRHDSKGARAVVDRYLGGRSVVGLKERARVDLLLEDSSSYRDTLRALMQVDRAHEAEYLRGLILSEVQSSPAAMRLQSLGGIGSDEMPVADQAILASRIRELLARLGKIEAAASTDGFKAAMFARAGLQDEAILAYRCAIARDPMHGAHYLALGNALQISSRVPEGVAMFQSLAESAAQDDVFEFTVEGIIAMATPDVGASGDFEDALPSGALEWARRMTFERLMAHGDGEYLYRIFAAIAGRRDDGPGRIAATASALAQPNALRAATLRQLMTLTAPRDFAKEARGEAEHQGVEDPELHLSYARRLVALNETFPPEVYLQLGEALLKERQPLDASRAFNKTLDITGQFNIHERAGDLFDAAGYSALALDRYARAFMADSGNLGLMVKLGELRERLGQRDLAHRLFWQALQMLLSRQPQMVLPGQTATRLIMSQDVATDVTTTAEYKRFHERLSQGYLSTWPVEPPAQQADLATLEALVQRELEAAGSSEDTANWLPSHSRLDHTLQFAGRVTRATSHLEISERIASRAPRQAVSAIEPGTSPSATIEEISVTLNEALLSANPDNMLAAARKWANTGFATEAFSWAQGRLDDARLRQLCGDVAGLIGAKPEQFMSVVSAGDTIGVELLQRIQACSGSPLFAQPVLLKAFNDWGGVLSPSAMAFIVRSISAEQTRSLIHSLAMGVDDPTPTRSFSSIQLLGSLWKALLAEPLDPAMGELLTSAVIDSLRAVTNTGALTLINTFLATPDVSSGNRVFVEQVIQSWPPRLPLTPLARDVIVNLQAGHIANAADAFIALSMDEKTKQGYSDTLIGLLMPRYRSTMAARLTAFEAREGASKQSLDLRDRLFYRNGSDFDDIAAIDFLTDALAQDPRNAQYLARLSSLQQLNGLNWDATRTLVRLGELEPDNRFYRAALYEHTTRLDDSLRAAALSAGSPEDLQAADYLPRIARGMSMGAGAELFLALPKLLPAMTKDVRGTDLDRLVSSLAQAADAGDDTLTRNSLRALWQRARPGQGAATHEQILALDWPAAQTKIRHSGRLLATMTGYAFSPGEFEDYVRALDHSERDSARDVYAYLGDALRGQGAAQGRLTALRSLVIGGKAGDGDFTMWLSLLAASKEPADVDALHLLAGKLVHGQSLSQYQLLCMARIHAQSALSSQAGSIYRLLAERAIFAPLPNGMGLNALELIDDVVAHIDGTDRTKVVTDILRISAPDQSAGAEIRSRYDRFTMIAWERAIGAKRGGQSALQAIGPPRSTWSRENLITCAGLELRAGRRQEALRLLEMTMQKLPQIAAKYAARAEYLRTYSRMLGLSDSFDSDGVLIEAPIAELETNGLATVSSSRREEVLWLHRTFVVMQDLLTREGFDRDVAIQWMAKVIERLHEDGQERAVEPLMSALSQALVGRHSPSAKTIAAALSVAERVGRPLDMSVMLSLFRAGRLPLTELARVVRRTATEEGIPQALALGEAAVLFTQNDAMLGELIHVAPSDKVEYWMHIREKATQSREALGETGPGAGKIGGR